MSIFSNTVASLKEYKLLSTEKIRRLLDANFSDAVKMLYDYGYGDGVIAVDNFEVDTIIAKEMRDLFNFTIEYSPNNNVKDFLLNRYIYSNIIALYKAKIGNTDVNPTLFPINVFSADAFNNKDYTQLPLSLGAALTQLDSIEEITPNQIDKLLTNALYKSLLANAKKVSKQVTHLIVAEIDLKNIVALLRVKLSGSNETELNENLLEGGTIKKEVFAELIDADYAMISKNLSAYNYTVITDNLLNGLDVLSLEKQIDNFLFELVKHNNNNILTTQPFISYFYLKISELKAVKMLLTCLKNNVPLSEIKKRLRGMYEQ